MNEIFDSSKLPGRRLGIRKVLAPDNKIDKQQVVTMIKREMAMQLATKMLEGEPFFKVFSDDVFGHVITEYSVDCIVLTADEYIELKKEMFKAGMKHAQGFISNKKY